MCTRVESVLLLLLFTVAAHAYYDESMVCSDVCADVSPIKFQRCIDFCKRMILSVPTKFLQVQYKKPMRKVEDFQLGRRSSFLRVGKTPQTLAELSLYPQTCSGCRLTPWTLPSVQMTRGSHIGGIWAAPEFTGLKRSPSSVTRISTYGLPDEYEQDLSGTDVRGSTFADEAETASKRASFARIGKSSVFSDEDKRSGATFAVRASPSWPEKSAGKPTSFIRIGKSSLPTQDDNLVVRAANSWPEKNAGKPASFIRIGKSSVPTRDDNLVARAVHYRLDKNVGKPASFIRIGKSSVPADRTSLAARAAPYLPEKTAGKQASFIRIGKSSLPEEDENLLVRAAPNWSEKSAGKPASFIRIGKASIPLDGDKTSETLQNNSEISEPAELMENGYKRTTSFVRIGQEPVHGGTELITPDDEQNKRASSFVRIGRVSSFVRIGKKNTENPRPAAYSDENIEDPHNSVGLEQDLSGTDVNRPLQRRKRSTLFVRVGRSPTSFMRIGKREAEEGHHPRRRGVGTFVRIG